MNFTKQFPSGVSLNAAYPHDKLENHDINLSKAVNGDDGSDHEGYVTLGGLKASRFQHRIKTHTVTVASPTVNTITIDASLGSSNGAAHYIATSGAGVKLVTLDFQSVTQGDQYLIGLLMGEPTIEGILLTWGGSGVTHRHPGGSGFGSDGWPKYALNSRTMWRGEAFFNNEIWWSATSL